MPTWDLPTLFIPYWRNFLQWDYITTFGSTFVWLGLLFHDMKQAELLSTGWTSLVLMSVAITVFAGLGTVTGLAWLWREETISRIGIKRAGKGM